jgi:integrase
MPLKSDKTVHILEGKAILFKRDRTPHWHVRYKVSGAWQRTTTKCEELKDAKLSAEEIVSEARFRERNQLPTISKRFTQVAKLAINRMQQLEKAGQGKATFKTYTQAIERYLIPKLGNHNIDRITASVMNEFYAWRIEQMGKSPSESVINNHNSALNRVFDEAVERGYMTKTQVPLLRNDGFKSERRPDFTAVEYRTLYKGMRKWVATARKGHESELRQVMREYVLTIANVGFRAGTEGMNLKWSNVYFFEENGKRYLALWVDGKTKAHEMTARHGCIRYLDRLRKRTPKYSEGTFEEFLDKREDDYVFRIGGKDMTTTFGRMFKRLLTQLGLLIDGRTRKERTLYSLRHMYATYALSGDRVSIHQLARHMDTSVGIIEKHYSHILLRKNAAQFGGDRGLVLGRKT